MKKIKFYFMFFVLLLTACGSEMEPLHSNMFAKTSEFGDIDIQDLSRVINGIISEIDIIITENPIKMEDIVWSYNTSYCTDWQLAYLEKLSTLKENNRKWFQGNRESDYVPYTGYSVYDVDGNGVPELILRGGLDEAGKYWEIYTYENNEVVLIDDLPGSHTDLYTYPSEQALFWVHSDPVMWSVDKLKIGNRELLIETIDRSEGSGDMWDLNDYDPKSQSLNQVAVEIVLPLLEYDENTSVNILDWQQFSAEEAQSALEEALSNKREIYAVDGDTFSGSAIADWKNDFYMLEEILQGKSGKYETDYHVAKIAWVDFNGDGIKECLLDVETAESREKGIFVLSYQDETVFGYCFSTGFYGNENETYYESGIIYDKSRGYYRIYFYKDQIYSLWCAPYATRYEESEMGKEVEWENYEP